MNNKKIGLTLGLYGMVTYALFALIYFFYLGSAILLINNLVTASLFALFIYLLKINKISIQLYSLTILVFAYLALLVINIVLGGISSPMNYWFIACILGAAFLIGLSGLLSWTIIVTLSYSFLLLIKDSVWVNSFQLTLDESQHFVMSLSSLYGVASLIFFFAWYYLKINDEFHKYEKRQNERLNILLKILNHDLASPLMVTKTLVDREKGNISEANFHKLAKAHQTMIELVESVRKIDKFFSKEPRLTQVKLRIAVEDVVEDLQVLFHEKNIQVDISIPDNSVVSSDEFILKNNILKNLMTNAFKFSQENSTMNLTFEKGCLKIQDFGTGIPSEDVKTIFDFALSSSKLGTKGERGTGFGLPIVKEFCDRMGISISVMSSTEAPSGTTFLLKFS
jgi:signal transduction histidine kinase